MKVVVSGIHLKKFPEAENYAKKKVGKLTKLYPNITVISVRLISEESHRGQEKDYYCEIEVDIPRRNLSIIDTERDMDKAIDRAVRRMSKLLRRTKEKTTSKKHKEGVKVKESRKYSKLAS